MWARDKKGFLEIPPLRGLKRGAKILWEKYSFLS
jgi:hypothetical protein